MSRTHDPLFAGMACLLMLGFCSSERALSDDATPALPAAAAVVPVDLARRIGEITDAVLQHHIDPPARQQMILGGVKALYQASGVPVPAGLGRRVSAVATPEQLAGLLENVWPRSPAKPVSADALEEALLTGLLGAVPGGAQLASGRDLKVAEQIEGNRYVGIQISLSMDETEKLTKITQIFEGGPADRAGARTDDLIEKVNDKSTKGMTVTEVVNRLRGDEGTDVTITVRQPNAKESRVLKMTRATMPRVTVRGLAKRSGGGWAVRINGPDPVGYLRITEITGSTPHELRTLARQLENEGCQALVLDLRGLAGQSVHPTVLVADSLLSHGLIGRVYTAEREMTYEADPEALFLDWPMAVLIDEGTWGTAEWLAAALQDNHRAILVGSPSRGASRVATSDVRSRVPVGDGSSNITLLTGYLERGDRRPLSARSSSSPIFEPGQVRVPGRAVDKPTGGVRPDHAVGPKPKDNDNRVRTATVPFGDMQSEWADPVLKRGVELLRASRKKT